MKKFLILVIIITFAGCGNGYFFETKATYQAVVSGLDVQLIGKGFVIDGDDLSNDGLTIGCITSAEFSDTIYFKANEWKFISLEHNDNEIINPASFTSTVADYLTNIGHLSYRKQELAELGKIIQLTAYGPKATYVDGQTDLIKVIQVNFETTRGNQKHNE